jgi:hypothetical protein
MVSDDDVTCCDCGIDFHHYCAVTYDEVSRITILRARLLNYRDPVMSSDKIKQFVLDIQSDKIKSLVLYRLEQRKVEDFFQTVRNICQQTVGYNFNDNAKNLNIIQQIVDLQIFSDFIKFKCYNCSLTD